MRMSGESGPRAIALLTRAVALAVLIVHGGALALRSALASRGIGRLPRARVDERYRRFAVDFVATATRYRGGLIKLGQVASLRIDVLPASVTEPLAQLL